MNCDKVHHLDVFLLYFINIVCSPFSVCYSPPTTDAWYFADYNIAQSIGIMAFGEYIYNYIDSKATSVIQCNKIYQNNTIDNERIYKPLVRIWVHLHVYIPVFKANLNT